MIIILYLLFTEVKKMKKQKIIIIVFALMLAAIVAQAQMIIKKSEAKGGEFFFINELALLVMTENNSIKVEHILPTESRPEEYRDIEIKKDDEILMVNKKRVKSVTELKNVYDTAKISDKIKLGLRRGEEMFIIEFAKMDADRLPKRKIMVMSKTIDSSGGDKVRTKIFSNDMVIDDKEGPVEILMGTGLIFQEKNGKIIVIKNMLNFDQVSSIKEGAEVISLNNTEIKSLNQFCDSYKQLETGKEVKLVISFNKKQMEVVFEKPAVKGKAIIREKN